ncbi:hypothetical protein ABZ434_17535 [Streptomyces sp. NPDC005761]
MTATAQDALFGFVPDGTGHHLPSRRPPEPVDAMAPQPLRAARHRF